MADYEDVAIRFDQKIPPEVRGVGEIAGYMRGNYGHVLPDSLIDETAPQIERRRERRSGNEISTGSQVYFDTDAGQWRDPETGNFVSGPEDDG